MTDYKSKLFTQSAINAVFLSGILGFLIRPFVLFGYNVPDMGFLAWVHLVPLILGIHRYKFSHKIILCFLSYMVSYYGNLYWLMTAMQVYGGMNFFQGFAAMTLLFAVLSLFYAIFLSFACWINHLIKVPFFILLPVFMTTIEYVLNCWPCGGFPWTMVAYTQREWLQFFQWVDHTGVFGLCFLIYLVNGLFADGLLLFLYRRQVDKMVSRFLLVFVIAVLSLFLSFLSSRNYDKNKTSKGTLNVAMIQGNISQDVKWDPYHAEDNLGIYLKLTNTAVKDGADVALWPETAYPYGLRENKMATDKFLDKQHLSSAIIFGAVISGVEGNRRTVHNSVVLADTESNMKQFYSKMHLVPFGEYLPFKEYLSFLPNLTSRIGEFESGKDYTLFDVAVFKLAPLICFEDIFPKYARDNSLLQADILVNFTNDAWYGDTSAQYQHLVFSQFRALENRRYLVRTTNTGITAVINPSGIIVDQLEPFRETYLMYNLKVDQLQSYYTIHGDRWVYLVIAVCVLILIYTVTKRQFGPMKVEF